MKLFTRYNRINLLATVIVFLLSGIAFYFLLNYVLISQVDEDLKIEEHEIQTYAAKYQRLPEIITVRDQHTSYATVNKDGGKKIFSTIHASDGSKKEKDVFRQLIFFIAINGQWYQVTVSKSLEGTDDMMQSIVTITLVTILLILVISLLVNRVLLRKLWQPFYDSLTAMGHFELGKNKQPHFPVTRIDEFVIMNETLRQAMVKADQDYAHLKEFTENASHELQTPLAIIQSKLDVLIQDEHLSEPQSRAVQGAYDAIQRLSKLNHGLLLMTKIENGQYNETALINLSQKIKDKIIQFEEMTAAKKITLIKELDDAFPVTMNPALADILLNNLFSNAIKYCPVNGVIGIIVKNGFLEISNTGTAAALDETRLFRRFGKPGEAGDGIGLGLAIIHEVVAISGLTIRYRYGDLQHHFQIKEP